MDKDEPNACEAVLPRGRSHLQSDVIGHCSGGSCGAAKNKKGGSARCSPNSRIPLELGRIGHPALNYVVVRPPPVSAESRLGIPVAHHANNWNPISQS